MEGQAEFFSPKHKQLLSIATWAKYLAWLALVLTIANYGVGTILRFLTEFRQVQGFMAPSQNVFEAMGLIKGDAFFWIDMFFDFVMGVFRAVIYYVVLRGISLGLNMIVETDINYREKRAMEGQDGG